MDGWNVLVGLGLVMALIVPVADAADAGALESSSIGSQFAQLPSHENGTAPFATSSAADSAMGLQNQSAWNDSSAANASKHLFIQNDTGAGAPNTSAVEGTAPHEADLKDLPEPASTLVQSLESRILKTVVVEKNTEDASSQIVAAHLDPQKEPDDEPFEQAPTVRATGEIETSLREPRYDVFAPEDTRESNGSPSNDGTDEDLSPVPQGESSMPVPGVTPQQVLLGTVLVALGAGGAWLVWHRIAPGFASLFTRITKARALRQPTRQRLLAMLMDDPGQCTATLMERSELAEGTVRYHMRVLQRHHLVETKACGHKTLFFALQPDGTAINHDAVALLTSTRNRDLARIVFRQPGITQGQLSARLGLSQSRVYERVQRFVDLALIHKIRRGRCVTYLPTRGLEEALFPERVQGAEQIETSQRVSKSDGRAVVSTA